MTMSGIEQGSNRKVFGRRFLREIPARDGLHEIPGQLRRRAFLDDHTLNASLTQHTCYAKHHKEPFRQAGVFVKELVVSGFCFFQPTFWRAEAIEFDISELP